MIRRLTVALATAMILVGCSSDPGDTKITGEATPAQVSDVQVLDVLRQQTDYFDNLPETKIVQLFDAACGAWDRGVTVDETFFALVDEDVPARDAGALLAASAYGSCPEHIDLIDEWTEQKNN